MKLLGIDYGRKKIGLAVGDTDFKFAEPLSVIRFDDFDKVLLKIDQLMKVENIEQVVMGVSEGKMAVETKEFGNSLQKELKVPVVFHDETLTSIDAQVLSIEAGIKRSKRKKMEDAYAAAIMLQGYMETV